MFYNSLRLVLPLLMLCSSGIALAADRYTLGVKGVACPFCAFGVEKRLYQVTGVNDVQVDIAASEVHIDMDEGASLTESQARIAVEQAGFTLDSFHQDAPQASQPDAR